jgi:hypothetical protein
MVVGPRGTSEDCNVVLFLMVYVTVTVLVAELVVRVKTTGIVDVPAPASTVPLVGVVPETVSPVTATTIAVTL